MFFCLIYYYCLIFLLVVISPPSVLLFSSSVYRMGCSLFLNDLPNTVNINHWFGNDVKLLCIQKQSLWGKWNFFCRIIQTKLVFVSMASLWLLRSPVLGRILNSYQRKYSLDVDIDPLTNTPHVLFMLPLSFLICNQQNKPDVWSFESMKIFQG